MVYDSHGLRKARTLEILGRALLELLAEKSFEELNIVDICAKAAVHRTTFYNHFENKGHLLEWSVARLKAQLEEGIPPVGETATPQGYYAELLRRLILFLDAHPPLRKALVEDARNQLFWIRLQELFADDVRRRMGAFAAGGYRYSVSLELNAVFYTAGTLGALLWWLREDRPVPEAEFLSQVGILMDPRRELRGEAR